MCPVSHSLNRWTMTYLGVTSNPMVALTVCCFAHFGHTLLVPYNNHKQHICHPVLILRASNIAFLSNLGPYLRNVQVVLWKTSYSNICDQKH